jgi:hypothetical protein
MPSSLNGTGVTFNDATTLQSGNIPAANLGSGTANSTTFLRGDKTWAVPGGAINTQTFDSSGTWTKPSAGNQARIQVWGGGGGGGRANSGGGVGSGGGGGAYNEITVPLSYLAASVSITVGAGGAGATSQGIGGAGGRTFVPIANYPNGSIDLNAFGGAGGGRVTPQPSGGGGGTISAGSGLNGGDGATFYSNGTNAVQVSGGQRQSQGFHWGGGAGSQSGEIAENGGSNTTWGGGGGGGGTTAGSRGVSIFGGDGGYLGVAGQVPGGGGGAYGQNNNGSAGGGGRVIITVF